LDLIERFDFAPSFVADGAGYVDLQSYLRHKIRFSKAARSAAPAGQVRNEPPNANSMNAAILNFSRSEPGLRNCACSPRTPNRRP
jgi:hypothetical protein